MCWKRSWMGAFRGKTAWAWWDLLLISIRRRYDLFSRNICLLTSDYPHVPSNIQNTAPRWGHGPPRGTQDWQCQFHRLLVNNTICWMDHCLERDGRTWHLTVTCKTYFHTYLWIRKGPCIKKCFGKVAAYPPPPLISVIPVHRGLAEGTCISKLESACAETVLGNVRLEK